MNSFETQVRDPLLKEIKKRFYGKFPEPLYYRDQQQLIHAITWPCTWLKRRGLEITPAKYRQIISTVLANVDQHADRKKLDIFIPRYLLKSIQDYFRHNEETIYTELKSFRNILERLALDPGRNAQKSPPQTVEVDEISRLNELFKKGRKPKKPASKRKMQDATLPLFTEEEEP